MTTVSSLRLNCSRMRVEEMSGGVIGRKLIRPFAWAAKAFGAAAISTNFPSCSGCKNKVFSRSARCTDIGGQRDPTIVDSK